MHSAGMNSPVVRPRRHQFVTGFIRPRHIHNLDLKQEIRSLGSQRFPTNCCWVHYAQAFVRVAETSPFRPCFQDQPPASTNGRGIGLRPRPCDSALREECKFRARRYFI